MEELKDSSQLGKRGEIYFALQGILVTFVAFPIVNLEGVIQAIGILAAISGVLSAYLGLEQLGSSLTPLPAPRKGSELVTSGVFAYVRHPIYCGLCLVCLGASSYFLDATRLGFSFILLALLVAKANFEEELLLEKYGEEYKKYMTEVKYKIIPYLI